MRYKAIVFDLDGTLLYTLEDLYRATNHALAANDLPLRGIEEVRSYVGNGYRQLARLASPQGTPDEKQEQVLASFNDYYLPHSQDHTAPYPGIPQLLDDLRRQGMPLAVVSNKGDVAVHDLMDHFFPHSFAAVVGEREGICRKPAPDTVNAVLGQLGLQPRDIAFVGDSEVDVLTAANVGCDCILVTWGYRDEDELRQAGATTFAHTADELLKLLLA